MNALTDSCLCVFVYIFCDWLIRSFWLQGGAVYGEGTFTNCNFNLNSATKVSIEEERVADSEKS